MIAHRQLSTKYVVSDVNVRLDYAFIEFE